MLIDLFLNSQSQHSKTMKNITLSQQFDYKPLNSCEPISTLPDMCEPEQSISVKEILLNFTRGNVPNIARVPIYSQETDEIIPDPLRDTNFDYADYSAMLAQHQQNYENLKSLADELSSSQVSKGETPAVVPPNEA